MPEFPLIVQVVQFWQRKVHFQCCYTYQVSTVAHYILARPHTVELMVVASVDRVGPV